MKIRPMSTISKVYGASKPGKVSPKKQSNGVKDTLALSDFAKELSVAKAAVDSSPDIRKARVDQIKKQIADGTYNVTAEQIAEKIISKL